MLLFSNCNTVAWDSDDSEDDDDLDVDVDDTGSGGGDDNVGDGDGEDDIVSGAEGISTINGSNVWAVATVKIIAR